MSYWHTIAFKCAQQLEMAPKLLGKNKLGEIVEGIPSTEQKDEAVRSLWIKCGLTKPILKNVFFRNVPESVKAEDVMLFTLLKDSKAQAVLLPFFRDKVDATVVKDVPDLDVWEIRGATDEEILAKGQKLYENSRFVVMVADQFSTDGEGNKQANGRMYMRIYEKKAHTEN